MNQRANTSLKNQASGRLPVDIPGTHMSYHTGYGNSAFINSADAGGEVYNRLNSFAVQEYITEMIAELQTLAQMVGLYDLESMLKAARLISCKHNVSHDDRS